MKTLITDVTGLILVGGKSRRMGVDKAFLEVAGVPLFERVLNVFRKTFAATILVGSRSERFTCYGLPQYDDIFPGSALGGLHSGLVRVETSYVFAAGCDLPFPSEAVIRHLVALKEGYDAVVPIGAAGCEPLFAVYARSCGEPMRIFLEQGNVRILDLYPALRVRYVPTAELARLDGSELSFVNLNTPEEYARYAKK